MVRASWEKAGISKSTFIFLTYPTALQLFFNTVDDEYNTIFAKLTKKNIIWGYEEDYSQSDFESLGMNNNFP